MKKYPVVDLSVFRHLWIRFRASEELVTIVGRLIGMGSNFILFWLLVRALPPDQYAQLGLIGGLQMFAHGILLGPVLLLIGRETWAWHYEHKMMERLSGLLIGLMLIYLVGNATLVMLALPLGWVQKADVPGIMLGIVFYALWLVVSSLLNAVGILRERLPFSTYGALDGLSRAVVVGVLWLTHVKAPAWFYYMLVNLAGLIGTLSAYFLFHQVMEKYDLLLSRLWSTPCKFSRETVRFLLGSKSLRGTSLLQWMSSTGNRYVLEPLVSRTVLGIFLAGWGLGTMLLQSVEGFYGGVMMPVLYNRTSGKQATAPMRRAENGNYLAIWLAFLIPLLAVFIVFADRLVLLLLSKQMGTPTTIVHAGLAFMMFNALTGIFATFSLIERKLRPNVFATATALAIGLPALVFLTVRYGIEVGVWGLVLGASTGTLIMIMFFYKQIDWTVIARTVPMVLAGTSLVLLAAWMVFTGVSLVASGTRSWMLFPAWGVVAAVWAGYVWWGVRPRVTRTPAGAGQIVEIDKTPT